MMLYEINRDIEMDKPEHIENEIPFPLLRDRIKNPYELFQNLQNYIPNISDKAVNYKYILWKNKRNYQVKYKKTQYVSILNYRDDYFKIDRLVDYFNEIPRMKAKRRDKNCSPLEAWQNMEILKPWINNKMKNNETFSIIDLREQIWRLGLECNAFKASLAKSIYDIFKPNTILDFSAGWGDRLLGAIAYGANRYLGYDPNPELQKGYREMIEMFATNPSKKYEVIMEPFETAEITEKFDLVLTSPPYYDFETYISSENQNAKTQSINRYPQFADWMVNFLCKSLYKCWNVLNPGGNMVIHLSDVYRTNYVESMILFILGWCKGARFDGSIASIGDCGKPRPLWVFHKTGQTYIQASARENMKIYYIELYRAILYTV